MGPLPPGSPALAVLGQARQLLQTKVKSWMRLVSHLYHRRISKLNIQNIRDLYKSSPVIILVQKISKMEFLQNQNAILGSGQMLLGVSVEKQNFGLKLRKQLSHKLCIESHWVEIHTNISQKLSFHHSSAKFLKFCDTPQMSWI